MTARRAVTVRRDDGGFEIGGHRFSLQRSTHALTAGQWEVWEEDPDPNVPYLRSAAPGRGPGRPVAVAPSYREARALIDRAAARGGFGAGRP